MECHSCGWKFGPYPFATKYVREDGTCENCGKPADLRPILAQMQKDMEDAAGELLMPIPEPGTDIAKLMSGNILLRRENERLRHKIIDALAVLKACARNPNEMLEEVESILEGS
jgi:hypothetical protein